MKKKIPILCIFFLLFVTKILMAQDLSKAENIKKSGDKSILIEIRLSSEVDGNIIKMTPKIVVLEDKLATVKIGNEKAKLNEKEVRSDRISQDEKIFLANIEITPSIIKGTSPAAIKMDVKFYLDHNGYEIRQNFTTAVIERDSFFLSLIDQKRKQKLDFVVKASITQ